MIVRATIQERDGDLVVIVDHAQRATAYLREWTPLTCRYIPIAGDGPVSVAGLVGTLGHILSLERARLLAWHAANEQESEQDFLPFHQD
jgi:hypothetical protein